MNKQEILNKYDNEEDRLLVSKILDKLEFVQKKNIVETTDFLDMHQKAVAEKVLKSQKITNYICYGGYSNAERVMLVMYPEKLEDVFNNNQYDFNNIVKVVKVTLPNEMRGKYSHRDYLGAVIKIGLKREKVGDIIVNLDGADLIVSKDISKYIVDSFKEITRFSKSDIYEESIEKLNITEPKTEVLNIIIPSMRMDSIVSELIRTSRSKALEIINAERVFVNSEVITKNSKMLKENDIITVKGKGRFKIIKILNSTKKGNLVLEVEKYI